MSIEAKDARKVVALAFERISKLIKTSDPKDYSGALEGIEQNLLLARMVMDAQKLNKGKKPKKGKKRKAEAEPTVEVSEETVA